jgi:hypothetical protein
MARPTNSLPCSTPTPYMPAMRNPSSSNVGLPLRKSAQTMWPLLTAWLSSSNICGTMPFCLTASQNVSSMASACARCAGASASHGTESISAPTIFVFTVTESPTVSRDFTPDRPVPAGRLHIQPFAACPRRGSSVTASVVSEYDSPANDVEDSDTSNRADSGCSAAAVGRGEAGHPAQNPRCAPPDHLYGAVRAAHRGPTARSGH